MAVLNNKKTRENLYNVVNGVDDSVGGNNVGFLNSGTGALRYYLHYTSLEHLDRWIDEQIS